MGEIFQTRSQIFVLEDDAALAREWKKALVAEGFEVKSSRHFPTRSEVGPDFRKPTLFLWDLDSSALRDMPPPEVAAKIRGARTLNAAVLVMQGSYQTQTHIRELGEADVYLTKPVSTEELVARVRSLILEMTTPVSAAIAPPPSKEKSANPQGEKLVPEKSGTKTRSEEVMKHHREFLPLFDIADEELVRLPRRQQFKHLNPVALSVKVLVVVAGIVVLFAGRG